MKKTSTLYLTALVWLLLLVGTVESFAQQTQRQTPVAAGLVIKGFWEYLPPGYSPTGAKVPCIIFLHGSGERGLGTSGDLNKILNNGPPKHIKNGHNMCFTVNGKTECFMVLSPQTNKWSWKSDVMPFVKWALQNYNIDPDRLYCTGLSMGGEGTWFSACFPDNDPNVWAAIGVMCGRASRTDGGVVQGKKISVWAFHGEADTAIPLNAGLNPILGMRTAGGNPLWTTYPGVGHGGCWDRGYRVDHTYHNPNLYEWFLSIKRNNPGPKPPTVNAGIDITLTLPTNTTTLTGTATDPDGTIASTSWALVSGPNVPTIASPSTLSTGISGLVAGTYTFGLTATDNTGLATTDQIVVKVNPAPPKLPPVANAGTDKSITSPASSISITGSGTDSDGTIASYLWKQDGGPNTATLAGTTTTTLNASNLVIGTYTFSLTVTDNDGLSGTDQVVVVVNPPPPNAAPDANAGVDKSITLPTNSVNLVGTGTDPDGSIAAYEWSQSSGPSAATITPTNMAATNVSNLVEGVYVFTLKVTDNNAIPASDNDQVIVTVLPVPPNLNPTASAGTDITITSPATTTTLNGSGTDTDGTIATYAWIQTSGPNTATIATPSAGVTGLSDLIVGNYLFTLTVTDNRGGTGSDQVLVQVLPPPPNDPPVANAGSNVSITLPLTTAQLNGSGTDSDGTVTTYLWTQQGTTPAVATLATPGLKDTQVNNLTVAGVYTFELTVGDDDGATGSDLVTVTVFPAANIPPSANAGGDVSITLPISSTPLSGSGTDSDGTISTYAWAQVSGPNTAAFSNTSVQNPTASGLVAGIYILSLTVTDNSGATATDQVQVTVAPEPPNQLPNANAGADVTLTLPTDETILNGAGTDTDGTIVSYHWNLISGPATVTLSDVDQQILNVSDLVAGTYSFELVVSDNRGATATDEVKIFVNAMNVAPTVSAGPDRSITLPTSSATLNGSGSDPDGTIVARLWEQVSGPATATIVSFGANTTVVNNLVQGIYVFSFKVTDDDGVFSTDQVTVTVNPAPPNNPPVADAGADLEITLPVSSISTTGSGTDSDGTISTYLWSQVSGPTTATLSNVNQQAITFSSLAAGTYVFRLTVTDNKGAKGENDVSVKVNPAPVNVPPTVNAGIDQVITLPVNMVSLAGLANDTDGSIATYEWTLILGTSVVFSSPNTAATNVPDLEEGVYVFRLKVVDDDGAIAFDELKVTVKPIPANLPPIADAGGNKVLTLPTNSTSLTGSGSDSDGSVASYEWQLISSPLGAPNPLPGAINTATINISNLIEGIYLLRLTVTDDKGSTGFDEINVRVQPIPANQPPTADAGDNKIIELPTNTVTFEGTGTDPDGTISSYAWTFVDGPTVIAGAATPNLTANGLVEGTYIFRLTVKDNLNAEGFDEVNVRVNPEPPNKPPVPNAGIDIAITLPTNSANLDASGSVDNDGTIASFVWSFVSGPSTVDPADGATTTASGLIQGIYIFRVTTQDNDGEESFDDVQVTVNPQPVNNPPIVFAGDDQILTGPTIAATLTGTASDSDGTIAAYKWTGPVTPTPDNTLSTTVNLTVGTYIYTLEVTDDRGDKTTDQVTITVNPNQNPVAIAGGSFNVVVPGQTSITLNGVGTDADGTITDFHWELQSGPSGAPTSVDDANLEVSGLVIGTYVYELTVTDDKGAQDTDEATIVVTSTPTNQIPVARAGDDVLITLPTNSVSLNGLTSTDADGTISSFAWELVTDLPATLSDTTFAELEVTDMVEGTYVFALTVTDNNGAIHTDQVTIIVSVEEGSLIIPKVFTPNGDDKGQTWTWPAQVESMYEGCELTIYSRFGKKVFEMVSYDSRWDGTMNGVKLDEDAYYYIIKCSDGQQTTGGVRIVR